MKSERIIKDNLQARTMHRAELDLALEWAAAEGWNPGLKDAECFYAADPEGFFVALFNGLPIGSISAVRHGADCGFIGLFIVKPEYRGQRAGLYPELFALLRSAARDSLRRVAQALSYAGHPTLC